METEGRIDETQLVAGFRSWFAKAPKNKLTYLFTYLLHGSESFLRS